MQQYITPIFQGAAVVFAILAAWFLRSRLNSISQCLVILDVLARNRFVAQVSLGVDLETAQGLPLGGCKALYEPGDRLHRRCDFSAKNVALVKAWPGTQITCVRCNGASVTDQLFPALEVAINSEDLRSGSFSIFCEPT